MRKPNRPFAAVLPALILWFARAAACADPWSVDLVARHGSLQDRALLRIGAAAHADDGFGPEDVMHPPSFPDRFMDAFVLHSTVEPGWKRQPGDIVRYAADIAGPLGEGTRTVDFTVQTDRGGTLQLEWSPEALPVLDNHTILLRDTLMGGEVDMRTVSVMGWFSFGPQAHTFQLEFRPKGEDPLERWEKLVDLAGAWRSLETYSGPGDLNGNGKADEGDLYLLCREWR